jgi:hypothetical protein
VAPLDRALVSEQYALVVGGRRDGYTYLGGTVLLVLAVGVAGGCGSSGSDAPASASSIAMPSALESTTVLPFVPPTASVGSTQPTSTDSLASSDGSVRDQAAVVVAAATHRLYRATGMADPPTFDQVNVIDRYGSPSMSGNLEIEPDGRVIDDDVRAAVERALAPSTVAWVDHWADVIGDLSSGEDATHQHVEVLLTFGEPMLDEQRATIVLDLVCGTLCGDGTTYVLDWSDAQGWTVTGTTRGWLA